MKNKKQIKKLERYGEKSILDSYENNVIKERLRNVQEGKFLTLEELREHVRNNKVEVCGGKYKCKKK